MSAFGVWWKPDAVNTDTFGLATDRALAKQAFNAGLEAAAKVCEKGADMQHPIIKEHMMKNFGSSAHLARAIRALKE